MRVRIYGYSGYLEDSYSGNTFGKIFSPAPEENWIQSTEQNDRQDEEWSRRDLHSRRDSEKIKFERDCGEATLLLYSYNGDVMCSVS